MIDVTPHWKQPKPPKVRKPMRSIGKKSRLRDQAWQDAKRVVRARSKGRCEIRTTDCTYWASEVHHVEPSGMGGRFGKHDPDVLLDSCPPCHRHLHAHPNEAVKRGWLRRRSA